MSDDLPHNYRLVSVLGIERKLRGIPARGLMNQASMGIPAPDEYPWVPVDGEDLIKMNWQELRHISDILKGIEDAGGGM